MHRFLKFLTVIIGFISIILVSRDAKYVLSVIRNYFSLPRDDPIFRNLANSTTILIEDLVKFKFPASSKVIDLRVTSIFLSDVISRSSTPANLSPALYLQSLGDKSYIAGTQIEKMYSTGSFALGELSNELQDIRKNLPHQDSCRASMTANDILVYKLNGLFSSCFFDWFSFRPFAQPSHNPILSQKETQYFVSRFDQILRLVTRFRGKLADIEGTIQEIQKLYRGYDNVQGFSEIIEYFKENEPTYKQTYDMKMVQRELDSEREQMDQLMDVDREVARVVQSIDLFGQKIVSFMEEVIYLSNKKIVSQEDCQVLEEVIETVEKAKKVWDRMDKMDDNHTPQIEG